MYPQVFLDYQKAYNQFGDVTLLDTPTFFQGIRLGETINVQIERGKTLIIRLDEIGEPDIEGIHQAQNQTSLLRFVLGLLVQLSIEFEPH